MDNLNFITKKTRKLCYKYLIVDKNYRKDLFCFIARNIILQMKKFPDEICRKMIIKELRNEFEFNRNVFINKRIFPIYKDFVNFEGYVTHYENNFVLNFILYLEILKIYCC